MSRGPHELASTAEHRVELDLLCDGAELLWRAELASPRRSPLRAFFRRPWDAEGAHELANRVRRLIEQANGSGRFGAETAEELRRCGALLFDDVLASELKHSLRELGGGTLDLGLSEPLLALPWELLHDGTAFLAERWSLGRRVIASELSRPVLARAPLAELDAASLAATSVLILADPVGDLAEAYNEGVAIRALLEARRDVEVTFRSTAVTRADVREVLRDYDVVHFAGHVDAEGLRLADGHLGPEDVARLSGGRPLPHLVFLNGCAAGDGGTRIGLARAFLRGGTSHCLGPLYDVPDAIGRELAVAFYRALGPGVPVGTALSRARAEVAERVGERAVLWAPYVLYGCPDAPGLAAPEPDRAAPPPSGPDRPDRRALPAPDALDSPDDSPEVPVLAPIVATRTGTHLAAGGHVRRAATLTVPAPAGLQPVLLAALAALLLVPLAALVWLGGASGPVATRGPAGEPTPGATPAASLGASEDVVDRASAPPGTERASRDVLTYHFTVSREDETLRPLVDGQPLGPGDRLRLDLRLRRAAHVYVFRVGPERIELLGRSHPAAPEATSSASQERLVPVALPRGDDGGWEPGEPGYHTLVVATRATPWEDPGALVAYLNDVLAVAPADAGEWHDERALRLVRDTLLRRHAEVHTASYEARVWE